MRRGWGLTLGGAAAPAWTPLDLGARLAIWHDAEFVTLTSGAVSSWDDLSGNGRHATQTTAASRPTVDATGINGRPALLFDGMNDYLNSVIFRSGTASRSVFMVWMAETRLTSYAAYYSNGTSGSSGAFILTSTYASDPTMGGVVGVVEARDGQPLLAEGSFAGGSGGAIRVAKNDGAYLTGTRSINTTSAPRIGASPFGGLWFKGHIGALVGVADQATSDEVTKIREYFRARFSLW